MRHGGVVTDHATLHRHRAGHCVDNAPELNQHAVACRLDDAAVMAGDFGVDDDFSDSFQLREGAFLVGTHQAAVSHNIRRQNRR